MDKTSERNLQYVHPDLVKVIQTATQFPQPFIIVYGIRTEAAEKLAVASGHSTTMHSRHLPQSHENMFSCAVDVAAIDVNGHIDWAEGKEQEVYGNIWHQIRNAADILNIPVEWGGDWKTLKDFGHVQLPWQEYP